MIDQRYYWTPEWQAAEREAEADIAAGRVRTFANVADGIAWLMEADTNAPDDTTEGDDETYQPDDIDEEATDDPDPMQAGETDPASEPESGTEPAP